MKHYKVNNGFEQHSSDKTKTTTTLLNGYKSVVVSFPEIIGKISFVSKKRE